MNITYLDADTREVIKIADYPQPAIHETDAARKAKLFADLLNAKIVRLTPLPDNEWTAELKIPLEVRRSHAPLPGDRVLFLATAGIHSHEVTGTYQFVRRQSYIVLDDGGGEWELPSMWQMRKI